MPTVLFNLTENLVQVIFLISVSLVLSVFYTSGQSYNYRFWLLLIAPDKFFLLATSNAIRQVTINETGGELKDVMQPVWLADDARAMAIDYNAKSQMVYYSNNRAGKIMELSINGSQRLRVVADVLGVVDGLAVDWTNDLLYYTDTTHDIIGVVHTSGAPRKAIIESGLDQPRDIALDPANASVSCCLVALRTVF